MSSFPLKRGEDERDELLQAERGLADRVFRLLETVLRMGVTEHCRGYDAGALKDLVEGKFVDALRAVADEMAMEELHEQRVEFVQKVQAAVSEDLLKNGLELEAVSLTSLDQAVGAALRYRTQAPLLDSLLHELGLDASDLNGLTVPPRSNGAAGVASSGEPVADLLASEA